TSLRSPTRGRATTPPRPAAAGMASGRARSSPGAHGLASAIPRMVPVGSPLNISRRARPPFPAPTMTTLVMRLERLGLPSRESLEGGELRDERDLHLAGRAVALFADDDVRHAVAVLGLEAVAFGPVEEEDDVRVLLERARLAKVGQLGLLALPRLHRP